MGTKGFPPEFRRRVLDLGNEGRSVAEEAADLQISEQTISTWRRQALPGRTELVTVDAVARPLEGDPRGEVGFIQRAVRTTVPGVDRSPDPALAAATSASEGGIAGPGTTCRVGDGGT